MNICIITNIYFTSLKGLKLRSDEVKKGYSRAPHRSLLRATGLKDEDF